MVDEYLVLDIGISLKKVLLLHRFQFHSKGFDLIKILFSKTFSSCNLRL